MPTKQEWFGTQWPLVQQAIAELQAKTAAHTQAWGLAQADWNANLNDGTLVFTTPEVQVTTRMQVIATYNVYSHTWLWGWDHPSVPEPLSHAAQSVLAFAREHDLPHLQQRQVTCDEDVAWLMAALAVHLTGAQGAYRGPAGQALVFMAFDDVQVQPAPRLDSTTETPESEQESKTT